MTMMATSHTALSAAEDERCSCAETTTVAGEVSTGFYCVMELAIETTVTVSFVQISIHCMCVL